MATANPWQTPGQRYQVSIGGLQAFVQRNKIAIPNVSGIYHEGECYGSLRLLQQIQSLYDQRRELIKNVRELERLKQTITTSTSGCTQPHQLQLQIKRVAVLCGQLNEVLAAEPVIERAKRDSMTSESMDVELEHQRTFVDVFHQLTKELPYYACKSSTLESTTHVNADLKSHQSAYEAAVDKLKTTISLFQNALSEISQTRKIYSQPSAT